MAKLEVRFTAKVTVRSLVTVDDETTTIGELRTAIIGETRDLLTFRGLPIDSNNVSVSEVKMVTP
jgi:uncharacterized DUF497 family protein